MPEQPEPIVAKPEDFQMLWRLNPVAAEQLHWITLERLLREKEAELEARGASESNKG